MSEAKCIPCIIIPGFGQSKIALSDENGNFQRMIWPLRLDKKSALKTILPPYLKSIVCQKDKGFSEAAYHIFQAVLEPFSQDCTGKHKYPVKAVPYALPMSESEEKIRNYVKKLVPVSELSESIGDENLFFFAFDAFEGPFETAEKLNKFIEYVKQKTGSNMVNLLAFSMGGPICLSYFSLYGKNKDIHRVMFLSCALGGSVLQADIVNRNVDKRKGYSLLEFISSKDAADSLRKILAYVPWSARENLLLRSLDAICDSIMYNSTGMWALLSPKDYLPLAKKYLCDFSHKQLKEKTDRYYHLQQNLQELLSAMQNNGTRFYCCVGYGRALMSVSLSQNISSDGILPITSSAPGVISADLGHTLPDCESEYLSPDKTVLTQDALFKNNTWFIKNLPHGGTARFAMMQHLVNRCLNDENFTDVYSDKQFPRFLTCES